MWRIKSISARDFMTFKAVDYSFENKCYVVRGNNLDNDGQLSNGSGKTSLVDIIAVALLGYSLTGRNAKDCVRWDSEDGFFTIQLDMENLEHKLTCSIRRKVYNNTKSGELVVLVNDKVPDVLPSKKGVENGVDVRAGDAYILESILDLNSVDLTNYYLISGKYYQPFLKVNTEKKLEVIHRFSKAEVIEKAIKSLGNDQESLNESIDEYQGLINIASGYIQALEDSLSSGSAEQAFNEERQGDIDRLTGNKEEIEKELLRLEKESVLKQAEIVKLETSLQKVDEDWMDEASDAIAGARKPLSVLSKAEKELNVKISHIENHLAGLINCPNCKHRFSLKDDDYTEKDLRKAKEELLLKEAETNSILDGIDQLETEWKRLNEIKSLNDARNSTIKIRYTESGAIVKQQERLANEYADVEERLEKVSGLTFKEEKKKVKSQIKDKEDERLTLTQQLAGAKEELENITKWVNNFEDFKFYVGNKPLEIICSLVNQYLQFNGSDLNLHIEGFKKLKSGEIRQALTPVIYRNWMNPKDYNQFSEGEKTRLNLSTDLAFQQLINSSSKYGGLDFYMNDELLNPLDSLGINGAAESFNRLGKTILLVSQAGADMNYDNTILVEKKNSISRIL